MKQKPYVVTEYYYAKEEYFDKVMNILKETSALVEKQDGALMSLALKPENKKGAITSFTMWESRDKFTDFMKSTHLEEIMQSGLSEKVRGWTTNIKASLYTVEQAWHVETHESIL